MEDPSEKLNKIKMRREGSDKSPPAQQRLKPTLPKPADLFHSQIHPEITQAFDTESSLRASNDLKAKRKEDTPPVRSKVSSFLEGRSSRLYDTQSKPPDFSELDQRRAAEFYKRESELKESKIR